MGIPGTLLALEAEVREKASVALRTRSHVVMVQCEKFSEYHPEHIEGAYAMLCMCRRVRTYMCFSLVVTVRSSAGDVREAHDGARPRDTIRRSGLPETGATHHRLYGWHRHLLRCHYAHSCACIVGRVYRQQQGAAETFEGGMALQYSRTHTHRSTSK